jgi:2-polyprenyl-6-hydroxyphenyl methylase/3-demethylubiquinone-9 3-methyltransferase
VPHLQHSFAQHRSQEDIFRSYDWWNKRCLLWQITGERCDYIEACIDTVLGREALHQQEILEVGCGGGLVASTLVRRGAIVYGIDPSAESLVEARTHLQQDNLGQNAYFQRGYAEALPYADGSFSVIVCMDVLEHVSNLDATIREIARVLAPGGVFVFDTINRTLLARLVLIWLGESIGARFPSMGLVPGIHHYAAFIRPQELRSLLAAHGLRVQEMTGFIPRGLKRDGLKFGPGPFMGISYIGYATKGR